MFRRMLVTLSVISAPVGALQAAAPVPLADFVRRAQAEDMRISPDGRHLAMTVPVGEGQSTLVVVDRTKLTVTATMRGRDGDEVDRFHWVGNSRLVATMATRLGGYDRPVPTGEIFGINADGGSAKLLFGFRATSTATGTNIKTTEKRRASAEIVATLPGDDKRVVIAVYNWGTADGVMPEYGHLDVKSGRYQRRGGVPLARAALLADNTGSVRIAWNIESDQSRKVLVRPAGDGEWSSLADSAVNDEEMTPLRFARDNTHLYAIIGTSEGTAGLYRVNVNTHEKTLLHRGNADPIGVISTPDRMDAFAVVTADGKLANHIFEPKSAEGRMLRALQGSFPGQHVLVYNYTDDGRHALVKVASDRNPGDIYLFDIEKMAADYVTSPRNWIDPERMVPMQPVSFKARDGLLVHGYLSVPPGSDGKNLPLVVNPHGGPFGVRDHWRFNDEVQLLASRGYAVLQVNFRGSGGYGRSFVNAGYREWGGAMQDDLTDATHWAIDQGIADRARICIYGASYGAYAAIEGTIKEPDLYRCAIGYVGVYDLRLMRTRGDIADARHGRNWVDLTLGTDDEELWAHSPLARLDRLKAKLMIVAGGKDQRTPPVHSERLRDELVRRKVDHAWMYKPNEGHGFYNEANRLELYEKMIAFLDANIGATATPRPAAANAGQ